MKMTLKSLKGSAINSFSAGNKFNCTISNCSIANQIAQLLNNNNNLSVLHCINSIMSNKVRYFIELNGGLVVGCVGLLDHGLIDKIVHLSVLNTFRGMGMGKSLMVSAIKRSIKKELYIQIRSDNIVSMGIATSLGFEPIAYIPRPQYNIITLYLNRGQYV